MSAWEKFPWYCGQHETGQQLLPLPCSLCALPRSWLLANVGYYGILIAFAFLHINNASLFRLRNLAVS